MSDENPFQAIQTHNSILTDIRQMQDNLERLEQQVRVAQWIELGGRGVFEEDRCGRLCDGVRDSMDYIKEDIRELDPYNGAYRD